MKKIILFLFTAALIFVVYEIWRVNRIEPDQLTTAEDAIHEKEPSALKAAEYEMIEIEGIMRRVLPPGSLTTEHFLEDLDYMVYVLENNFALLEVANWAHGVDYRVLADNARAMILTMEEACEDTFVAIMLWNFIPLRGTGHFDIFTPCRYHSLLADFYWGYRGIKATMNYRLMQTALPYRFYGPRSLNEYPTPFDLALRSLTETYGPPTNRFWCNLSFNGVPSERLPYVTKIIEEGRIAYVSAGSMMEIWETQLQLLNFYREVSDYEHLIIDLRGNGGGHIDKFLDFMLKPHLEERIIAPTTFHFFMDGPYIRRFGDYLFTPTISSGYLTTTEPYRPAGEVLADNYLPEANLSDFDRLHYGAASGRFIRAIRPASERFANQPPAFGGRIWLLADHRMTSAAQQAAWYSKETGFATLVGDITGGCMGGPRTMAFMPNTGIIFYFDIFYITDSRGRPLEAGTIPHYFNRPGMDALQTVLR